MLRVFAGFLDDESGAVAVDWTVLTAAMVGTALVLCGVVMDGVKATASAIDESLMATADFSGPVSGTDPRVSDPSLILPTNTLPGSSSKPGKGGAGKACSKGGRPC